MTPTTDQTAVLPRARWEKWAILFLLLSAVTLRVVTVGTYDLWLDEFWTMELSTGRGSVHLDVPHNVVLDEAPRTTRLDGAPPWWTVWTSMERVTHPPLYFLLLRGWRETFGESDIAARLLSVAASAVSLLLLWDIARRMVCPAAAFWTCALFALAWPQIEYAQQVRNYAVLTALALGMLWAVVRMRGETTSDTTVANPDGWTWTRGVVLFVATLGTLLTHYFAAGTVAAMSLAVILCLRGRTRRLAASTMVLAGVAFLATWGPWMWEQRHVFRTTDPTTAFLVDSQPGHAWRTIARLVLQPGLLVAPLKGHWRWLALAGAVAWIWPLTSRERRARLLPAWLWMTGTITVIALLDLTRGTMHLEFPRYTLLAGPGAYLLIAAAGTSLTSPKWRPVGHVLLAAIVAGGLTATLNVEREWRDYRSLAAKVKEQTSSGDVIVFASPHYPDEWAVGALYLGFDHYSDARDRPILLLRGDLPADSEQRLRRAPRIWLVLEMKVQERPEAVLRGFTPVEGHFIYGFPAELWLMR